MLKYFFYFITSIYVLSSCGLNYTPPPTIESFTVKRKAAAESYVQNQYPDSIGTFENITFGETTVIKPTNYRLLDSLFELKYKNELRGTFDQKLEDQIGNQQQVVARDSAKVIYIEHMVYAVTHQDTSEVNFSDITLNNAALVTDFKITEEVYFPSKYLLLYKSYLKEESIAYPGYIPSNEEHNFYTSYKAEYQSLPLSKQHDFLVHTLKTMELSKTIHSLDTDRLIREICTAQLFGRRYNLELDIFKTMDGIFVDKVLTEYLVVLDSNSKTYTIHLTPYLEIISIQSE